MTRLGTSFRLKPLLELTIPAADCAIDAFDSAIFYVRQPDVYS